ncbi:hypothetical protein ACFX13_048184 [Malus domestica]
MIFGLSVQPRAALPVEHHASHSKPVPELTIEVSTYPKAISLQVTYLIMTFSKKGGCSLNFLLISISQEILILARQTKESLNRIHCSQIARKKSHDNSVLILQQYRHHLTDRVRDRRLRSEASMSVHSKLSSRFNMFSRLGLFTLDYVPRKVFTMGRAHSEAFTPA